MTLVLVVVESQHTRQGHGGDVTEKNFAVYLNGQEINGFHEYTFGTGAKRAMEKYVARLELAYGIKAIRARRKIARSAA